MGTQELIVSAHFCLIIHSVLFGFACIFFNRKKSRLFMKSCKTLPTNDTIWKNNLKTGNMTCVYYFLFFFVYFEYFFNFKILELQERARQMAKGNQKRDRSKSVAVGK